MFVRLPIDGSRTFGVKVFELVARTRDDKPEIAERASPHASKQYKKLNRNSAHILLKLSRASRLKKRVGAAVMQSGESSAYHNSTQLRFTRLPPPTMPWTRFLTPPKPPVQFPARVSSMMPPPTITAKPKQVAKRTMAFGQRGEPATKRRRIPWPKPPKNMDIERIREVGKWRAFIDLIGPDNCGAAVDLLNAKDVKQQWRIVSSICYNRAVATLRNRAGAIGAYVKWMQGQRLPPFPFQEDDVFSYLCFLQDSSAPPTKARSFVNAAKLAIGLLHIYRSINIFESPKIIGAVVQAEAPKPDPKQAPAFSLNAVKALEKAVLNTNLHPTKMLMDL